MTQSQRIEDTIKMTQQVAKDYWIFVSQLVKIRNLTGNEFANREQAKLYDRLNVPFKDWLAGLTEQDDREAKITIWKQTLLQLVRRSAQELMNEATGRDIVGIPSEKGTVNIFTAMNRLNHALIVDLGLKQGEKHEAKNS
ncbi:type I-E CRISPR-associated protein Cse1/CasA [Lacticaseibacillus baoqingensis]|uniref:type I-E CRISPR-associated protein Cse1/CasA n=1 Tax=Lacticaseibacillus baoqingensis TaxID=2486013 RepID=UPI0013DE2C43|nr:type I-E CRISPR-associated protein Cse1/CasA [Lacticaseibacillus baoqingensis]